MPNCGLQGSPPLRDWVFGTGIAYTIIGTCCSVFGLLLLCSMIGVVFYLIIIISGGAFTFAWMIVGSVSLWRDGYVCKKETKTVANIFSRYDCATLNYPVWAMGMAGVIISIVMVVASICSSVQRDDQ